MLGSSERTSTVDCGGEESSRRDRLLQQSGEQTRHALFCSMEFPKGATAVEMSVLDLSVFTRPRDLPSDLQRGRFDIPILHLHRDLGIIILEVKAIGDAFSLSRDMQSNSCQYDAIRRKVERSVRQLDKEEAVVRQLCGDVTSALTLSVTKVLVERRTVQAALMQDPQLVQRVCQCLATANLEDALDLCIFRDSLPPIGQSLHVSNELIEKLHTEWWLKVTDKAKTRPACMDDELYESLVARFCGPATTQYVTLAHSTRADVTTLQQAVLQTCRCFSQPVLTSEQFFFARVSEDHEHVHLLSKHPQCSDIVDELKSYLDTQRLQHPAGRPPPHSTTARPSPHSTTARPSPHSTTTRPSPHSTTARPSPHSNTARPSPHSTTARPSPHSTTARPGNQPAVHTANGVDTNSGDLPIYRREKLCLVMDEAPWFLTHFLYRLERALGRESFELWTASSFPGWRPQAFREVVLTKAQRCPPVVVMEMQKGHAYSAFTRHPYTSIDAGVLAGMPSPTDGPPVKRVQHGQHEGGRVTDVWDYWQHGQHEGGRVTDLSDCWQCGQEVAAFLTQDQQIGRDHTSDSHQQDALRFSDVIISGYLPDLAHARLSERNAEFLEADANGDCTPLHGWLDNSRTSSGFLRGLEDRGIPLDIVTKSQSQPLDIAARGQRQFEKLAASSDTNRVQTAESERILGLEDAVGACKTRQ